MLRSLTWAFLLLTVVSLCGDLLSSVEAGQLRLISIGELAEQVGLSWDTAAIVSDGGAYGSAIIEAVHAARNLPVSPMPAAVSCLSWLAGHLHASLLFL